MKKEIKEESLIVLLDDVDIWLKTVRLWLIHFGFKNVKAFSKVKDFMKYFEEHEKEIDACVVDFYLDDDGLDAPVVIKNMREINNDVLILAISADFINDRALLETEEMLRAMQAGANNVGVKEINSLQSMLVGHLEAREQIKDLGDESILDVINKTYKKEDKE